MLSLAIVAAMAISSLPAQAASEFKPGDTPGSNPGSALEFKIEDPTKGVFSVTGGVVNAKFCALGYAYKFDSSKMLLWNITQDKLATKLTAVKAIEICSQYVEDLGEATDISGDMGWCMTSTKTANFDNSTVEIVLNVGMQENMYKTAHGFVDHEDGFGFMHPATGVPYNYAKAYFQVVDANSDGDYTAELATISTSDFTPAHTGTESWTGSMYNPGGGAKECPVTFIGFPGDTSSSVTDIATANVAITAPVANASAQTTIADGTEYTGTIGWTPNDATFGYSKTYTANVTLTAKAGYTFQDATAITVPGQTVTNKTVTSAGTAGNSVSFDVAFPATAADPDIAIVAGVKSAIEGQTFAPIAQASCADATAAKSELNRQIQAMSLNGVTATVNEGTYIAPVAGEAGTPAGTNGSYKATVTLNKGAVTETTTQITLTITATAYLDPGTTAAPAFTSSVANKATATQTSVTFTLTADGTGKTYKVYSDSTGTEANDITATVSGTTLTLTHATDVAAGSYYISATESGKSESAKTMVTVMDPVAPTKPKDPSNGTVEQPGTTTGQTSYEFTYKSTETGTPTMGAVTLKRQDNQAFDLDNAVQADTVYVMTAAPAAGYKFTTWEKKTRAINPTSMTISGTFDELSAYTAQFAVISVNTPKLDQMTLTTGDGLSALLHADGKNRGFDSKVMSYNVNLMPGVTSFDLNMVIEAVKGATMETVLKVGNTTITPTKTTVGNSDLYTYTHTANVAADGPVVITLTKGTDVTEYTLNVATLAAKPQIVMDVEDKTGGAYDLKVSLEKTKASEFSFHLKLDTTAFAGFTKADATELTSAAITAELTAQMEAGSAFEVVKATYDATANDLYVTLATDGTFVDCSAKTPVMTLHFKTATGSSATMDDLKKLTIDGTNKQHSSLTDSRLNPMIETVADGKDGLIIINLPNEMTIVGYLNTVMAADTQATKTTITIKNSKDETVGTATLDNVTRRFTAKVNQGERYTLEIVLPNFVKNNTITVTGTGDAIVGAVTLLAGDLNNSDTVDGADRTALIAELYKAVDKGALGDIDGNGEVNGIDLGYLLASMGK